MGGVEEEGTFRPYCFLSHEKDRATTCVQGERMISCSKPASELCVMADGNATMGGTLVAVEQHAPGWESGPVKISATKTDRVALCPLESRYEYVDRKV